MERLFKVFNISFFIFISFGVLASNDTNHHEDSNSEESSEMYDPVPDVMHHISDAHDWHFFTFRETHFTIPLPVILFTDNNLDVFYV